MTNILSIVENLKKWSGSKIIPMDDGFYHLTFFLETRTGNFFNPFLFQIPDDLNEWWQKVQFAELFKDIDYGQWGLQLLSENESVELTKECLTERPSNFEEKDLVIGRFIGDSDLLLISCNEENFGSIIVALPIDKRKDWYIVSPSFSEFLRQYIQNNGNKFWEHSQ